MVLIVLQFKRGRILLNLINKVIMKSADDEQYVSAKKHEGSLKNQGAR